MKFNSAIAAILAVAICATLLSGCEKAATDLGDAAYKKVHAVAADYSKQLVDQGHALVQSNLRQLSATVAQGLPKDSKEALALLQQAANHGEAYAQSALGELYANGYGVPKDMNEAARWYQLAADQGVAEAKAFILEHARK